MSRGLGALQREIKEVLAILWREKAPTQFNEIAVGLLLRCPGSAEPAFERSARRALDGLLARGDVVVVGGMGTSKSPREFLRVEDFARLRALQHRHAKEVRNTADAKKIAAKVFNNPLTARMVPVMVQSARAEAARAKTKQRRR